VLLQEQIRRLVADPVRELADLPHNMTVYHRLMEGASPPGAGSLYEEAQALLFAGSDTVGATLMVGTFHLLREPAVLARLRDELLAAWPALDEPPKLAQLEQLPYLQAVIKEALRMSHGVVSGLLRVVPVGGATIAGVVGSAAVDPSCALQC
jgi:cytochrome P450